MTLGNVTVRDARIIFKNFSGKAGPFNAEGDRNFGVLLPEDIAAQMAEDGWNVKWLEPREEGDIAQPWISVSLKYRGRDGQTLKPPKVTMITTTTTGTNRTPIGEAEIETLDWAEITKTDIIIRPYEYTYGGRVGVKAYVQTLFVTVELDELEQQYAHLNQSPNGGGDYEGFEG